MNTTSKILLTFLAAIALCIAAYGSTSTGSRTLWEDEGGKDFAAWSDKLQIASSEFEGLETGDIVTVHLSAISESVNYPQVHLRTYGGASFSPAKSQNVKKGTAPCDVSFVIDEDALAAAADKGLAIAGIGFTTDRVTLTKKEPEISDDDMVEVEVSTTLWAGEQAVVGWSGAQQFTAAMCSGFKAGDRIVVSVSAISGDQSQVDLRNGAGWANFTPGLNEDITGKEMPCAVTFTLTEEVAEIVRTNGMVVTGCNFTFTKVEHITTALTLPSDMKGNASRTVWEGDEVISWVSGQNNSVLIPAASLGTLKEGFIARVYYKGMKPGATGRLLAGWTALAGQSNATLLGARYYEYTLSAANVEEITSKGLRISGNNYTATRVEIINPAKKYLIAGEADRTDIRAWEPGEAPKITVSLKNRETVALDATVEVDVDKDCYEDYCEKTETVRLDAGESTTINIPFDLEAGFYNLNVYVNGDNICSYVIGCDPKGVISKPDDNLADIKAYWATELAALKAIPIDAELTEIPSASTAGRTVYLVRMKSASDTPGGEPVEIRGFYAEPTADGTYPVLIQYQGTDGGTSTIKPINGDDNPGWCELVISTRGQMLNNRAPEQCEWAWLDPAYDADRAASGSNKIDYYAHGLNDKNTHYYRGANLDCIRAIDFVASRPKANTNNIFAAGGSQGGSFVYVAAALGEGRIRACAPSITGHSDFRDGAKIVSWPKNVFDAYLAANPAVSEDELYEFLSYYDVMNLATLVECPVITSFSLQDRTDPPHINVAPFNNIDRNKVEEKNLRYVVNPFLGHGTASDWKNDYMRFFNEFRTDLKPADPEEDINLWEGECVTGNWEGYKVLDAPLFATVKAGDYITVTVSETGETPQLILNNGSWSLLADADTRTPQAGATESFLITHAMLAELQESGLVVKGCDLTFTSVDIKRGQALKPDDPDAPVRTIWTGEAAIDWNKGAYATVAPSKFGNVKAGETLRFVYTNLALGAQGHLNCGWNNGEEIALPGASDYLQLRSGSYAVTVTDEMLASLKTYGLNILGVGHTLTEVQAIDYSRFPDVTAAVNASYGKYFEGTSTPKVGVSLTSNSDLEETVDITLALRHDNYAVHSRHGMETRQVTVPAHGSITADFELDLDPGVYHYVLTANYKEIADANIGYDLKGIVSEVDSEPDFEQFWTETLAELAEVAPEYSLTKLDEYSTKQRTVYLVEMRSVPDAAGGSTPVTVRGYYAEPTAEGKYPAVITYQGYDSNPETQQYIPHGDSNPDRIDFVLSTRGQGINNRGEYKEENSYYGDWFMFGFGDKDTYYYRGAYMDAVRAFDFVSSRAKTDKLNIFGEGHSQGGALTYAAAALVELRGKSRNAGASAAFNSIAPAIPFMGDFPDYFRIGAWPATQAYNWLNAQNGIDEDQMYRFLSYFDTKNLAEYVNAHVITAVGLQDETCPPHTNIAPFNTASRNGALDTSLTVNPDLGHKVHDGWNREMNAFFEKHMKSNPSSISDAELTGSIAIRCEGLRLIVEGHTGGDIRVFDISGRTVYSGNDSTIHMPARGVYVVAVESQSFKVVI